MQIYIKDLTKTYCNNKNTTVALDGVDFEVEKGDMVALMGVSGAGKSTLLHIIGGLLPYTGGTYRFDDVNVSQMTAKQLCRFRNRDIGIVLQHFALIADQSLSANVQVPMFFSHPPVRNKKERALALLEKVGLSSLADKLPSQVSGGEKQRCAIARALVNDPQLLLADEPTGQLDSHTAQEIMNLLCQLNAEGTTVILATHDDAVAARCKRILQIRDGKVECKRANEAPDVVADRADESSGQ